MYAKQLASRKSFTPKYLVVLANHLVKSDRNYALACNFSVLIEARFKVEFQDLCCI